MMFVCALIYLALVRHAKSQIRKLQQDHGLVNGALCTVQLDDESLQLATPNGTYRWPSESAKVYRTGKGMLLCPEPLFFVFVPKQNDVSQTFFITGRTHHFVSFEVRGERNA